ncbi:cytochrome b [Methylibium sp.]|uniref:cytochrome b n=1 Tax=Methylibium sp. TaxID=2067992 RepID=UPI003D1114C3
MDASSNAEQARARFDDVASQSATQEGVGGRTRYDTTTIVLHWLLALAIVGLLVTGFLMVDLPLSIKRVKLYNWHKWVGAMVLVASVIRLVWRLTQTALPAAGMRIWQRRAARVTHVALYALSLVVPLSGWFYSSAAGVPIVWFGWIPIPDLVPADAVLAQSFKSLHAQSAVMLTVLASLHMAAALKHHFVDRDGLLFRVWPGR